MIQFSVISSTYKLHTLETPIREAHLKPRNFNPHPYEQNPLDHQTSFDSTAVSPVRINQAALIIGSFFGRHPSNGINRFDNSKNN